LQVYHPNIDLEGNVCLNILREDWTPILNINIIIYGLFNRFTVSTLQLTLSNHLAHKKQDPLMTCDLECLNVQQPNHEDPLNSDAANVLRDDPDEFKSNVKRAMSGGSVGDVHFSSCLT
jgi:ubiquitin-conjugating enzyme E2 M